MLLNSAVGQRSIHSLYRDLEQEVLADDYYDMQEGGDSYRMILGKGAEQMGCGEVDRALSTYQCMD